jgi:CRP/FNR family cyclic AMP-dependent transcriptional regulator
MMLLDELEECRFASDFSPELIIRVASVARLEDHPANTILFTEGQPARRVYLVLQGEVALEMNRSEGSPVQVHRLLPGDLLSWSSLLGNEAQTATARTLTPCRLVALDTEQVRALGRNDARFARDLFRAATQALAVRLRALRRPLAGPRRGLHLLKEGAD